MRPGMGRAILGVVATIAALAVAWGGIVLWSQWTKAPTPISDRCVATAGGHSVAVDFDQAHNATIIAAVALNRNLPPRAVSIALATAYQESGIANLDYGHADSLGLFQQRPSKGWGTEAQIMDPYYSSAAFYKELVKFKNWKTRDINDIAQSVQRSAFPEAYRRHVPNARALASSLSGQTPASLSCVTQNRGAADPGALLAFVKKALKKDVTAAATPEGLTITATSAPVAWEAAHLAVAGVKAYGVATVTLGGRTWTHSTAGLADWTEGPENLTVSVTFAPAER